MKYINYKVTVHKLCELQNATGTGTTTDAPLCPDNCIVSIVIYRDDDDV